MPQLAFIRGATTNASPYVQLDTITGPVDAYCVNTGASSVHIVFGAPSASEAATMQTNGNYYILGSGLTLPVQRINPATTWVRSSTTTTYNMNWIFSW